MSNPRWDYAREPEQARGETSPRRSLDLEYDVCIKPRPSVFVISDSNY